MSRQILAIDIRNSSIAAVVLSTGLKNNTIEACAHVPLPTTGAEGENPLPAALSELLQKMTQAHSSLIIGLPADRTIYRTVFIPFKEDKKIRQVLPFELEPNLPVSVDQLVIDYQPNTDPGKNGLLAAAIDRHFLESVMADFSQTDLDTQRVVPGDYPLALSIAAHSDASDDQVLLLNVGLSKTTVLGIVSGRIELVRSLVSDISSETGIEALALKVRQTLTAFGDSRPDGFSVRKLFFSGPALTNDATVARLDKALALPSQRLDLRAMISKLDTAPHLDQWQPCIFDGALSLALIEAEGRACPHFHRSGSPLRNYWTTYRPYLKGPMALLVVVMLLALSGVVFDSFLLKKNVNQLNAQIEDIFAATFPQSRRVGDALDQMKSEIKKIKGGSIDGGQGENKVRTIDILHELSAQIPKEVDVVFSRLVFGNDGLTLSGEAPAFNTVDDVKGRLEKADVFKQVTIASANMDKGGNKVNFKLKIDL